MKNCISQKMMWIMNGLYMYTYVEYSFTEYICVYVCVCVCVECWCLCYDCYVISSRWMDYYISAITNTIRVPIRELNLS